MNDRLKEIREELFRMTCKIQCNSPDYANWLEKLHNELLTMIDELQYKMNTKYWDGIKSDNGKLRKRIEELEAIIKTSPKGLEWALLVEVDARKAAEAQLADKFETFEEWKASVIDIKELADNVQIIALEAQLEQVRHEIPEWEEYAECDTSSTARHIITRLKAILEKDNAK